MTCCLCSWRVKDERPRMKPCAVLNMTQMGQGESEVPSLSRERENERERESAPCDGNTICQTSRKPNTVLEVGPNIKCVRGATGKTTDRQSVACPEDRTETQVSGLGN